MVITEPTIYDHRKVTVGDAVDNGLMITEYDQCVTTQVYLTPMELGAIVAWYLSERKI